MRGGVSKAGLIELRSEAKAPFRLIRMFLTLGACVAAVVSLGVTLYAAKGLIQGVYYDDEKESQAQDVDFSKLLMPHTCCVVCCQQSKCLANKSVQAHLLSGASYSGFRM